MIRRILVPLDGSLTAETALGHAVAVATGLAAETMVLLRVLEGHGAITEPTVRSVDRRLRRMEARAYLGEVVARLQAQGVQAASEVVEGKAADEILQFVRSHGVDLVVLAAHGLGGAQDFPAGGTVHKVLSCAPASVMMIHPAAQGEEARARVGYRRVLVPVDGSPASEWALRLASSIARAHGAEISLLQMVPELELIAERIPRSDEEVALLDRLRELQHDRGTRYLQEMAARLARDDLTVRCRVESAPRLARAIQQIAGEEGADLIALSAHGAGEDGAPYGRVAQRLLTHSEIPVLVFQHLPGEAWNECPEPKTAVW